MKTLIIKDIVGPYCGTYEQGAKLSRIIYPLLKSSPRVALDFQGVGLTSSSFFNGAIVNLLPDFTDDDGRLRIVFCNLTPRDNFILQHTLKVAKHRDAAIAQFR